LDCIVDGIQLWFNPSFWVVRHCSTFCRWVVSYTERLETYGHDKSIAMGNREVAHFLHVTERT
jgi:hypothetical protein